MASYFAQATLQSSTGNTEDVQVNGFAAGQLGTLDATYAQNWANLIATFYDDVKAAGALRGMAAVGHTIKFYEIGNPAPNYPLFELPFTQLTGPIAVDLPQEVALCASYRNESATTIPRARRRGRVYISGWSEAHNTAGRPTAGAVSGLLNAYSDYVLAFNGLGTLEAGIWSRTNGVVYPVQSAFVDNEWDTMRSRGGKATSRSTWVIP